MVRQIFRTFKKSISIVHQSSYRFFYLSILAVLLSGVLSGVNVYSIQQLINSIQLALNSGKSIENNILIYFLVSSISIVLGSAQSYFNQRIAIDIDYYLEENFMKKCAVLQLCDFESENTYDLITKANELGRSKIQELFFNFLQLLESVLSVFSLGFLLFSIEGYFWGIIFIIPALTAIISTCTGKFIYNKEVQNIEFQRVSSYMSHLITNNIAIKEIINFNAGDYIVKKFSENKKEIKRSYREILRVRTLGNTSLSIIEVLVKIRLIMMVIGKTIDRNGLIGDVMGFIYSLNNIESKVNILISNITEIYRCKLYADTYFDFIDKKMMESNHQNI